MEKRNSYYIIEGEQAVKAAQALRKMHHEISGKFWDFVKSLGGTGYYVGFDERLSGIVFPWGKQPEGFRKPKRGGMPTYPMKKSPWNEAMSCLGRLPQPVDYLPELKETPCWMPYKYPGGSGGTRIGDMLNPIQICWYSGDSPFLLVLPNVERAMRALRLEHPEVEIPENILSWKPPAWAREILAEEWDLMVAQHKKQSEAA